MHINTGEFGVDGAIQTLTFDEIDLIGGANMAQDIGNTLMAMGAAGAGVGVVFGQPQIVAASAVIGGAGGLIWLAGAYVDLH